MKIPNKDRCDGYDRFPSKQLKSWERGSNRPNVKNGSLTTGYLRVKGAAEYLGTTEKVIRHLIDRGVLPSFRLGGRIYLSREEIDQRLRESRYFNGNF